MGITIKELADLSGYSCATISRVISNKGNVKKETREAIEKLLVEYNYRTNIMELRRSELKQKTILIIIGDLNSNYYIELLRIIKTEALKKGYISFIAFSDNSEEEEREFVKIAINEQYAGIIFTNVRGGDEMVDLLEKSKIPVVFLNRGIRFSNFDTVISDNYQGAYMITTYLIERGHKRIGHIMGQSYSETARERCRGFEDAMKDGKLYVSGNSIFKGNLTYESGYSFGERVIKKGLDYTAVFCGNDLMAIGFMDAVAVYGMKVPDDISVVCYDDTFFSKRAGLTTVGAEPEKLGKSAVDRLLNRISGHRAEEGTVIYRPRIISRHSVKRI